MEYDVIIERGTILDGTGNPWYKADIGVNEGRVVALGTLDKDEARSKIDTSGLVVTPGFIDMHTHSDLRYLVNSKSESKIRQGVTTEVIGNCGTSAAPLNDVQISRILKTMPFLEEAGVSLDWSSMDEYLTRIKTLGVSVNVAPLVGHGTIRAHVMGYVDRGPTQRELNAMKAQVANAMNAGVFGLSTGLIYTPGSYAGTREIIELCTVVAEFGGIYTSHIRGEASTLQRAVDEAIRIGGKAQVPVEISHHKASGKMAWGKVKETVRMMDDARKRGIDVTCDVYPYTATSFGLSAMLPPWAHVGGYNAVLDRLKDREERTRLKEDMESGLPNWSTPLHQTGWNKIMIASAPRTPDYEGKTIQTLAQELGVDPFNFVFNLLIEENLSVSVIRFALNEEDLQTVLKYPNTMIGSDGSSLAPYGPLSKGKPHPRNYGTFPRVLRRYVREQRILTWQDAIRKMTSLPAQKLHLHDRGLIMVGSWADLVAFDPRTIADTATFQNPHQYPTGIEYVLVNGTIVLKDNQHTNEFPGHILRLT